MRDPAFDPDESALPWREVIHRVERPDAELYLEDTGPEDAPALLYLHGGPGYNSYSFRALMAEELSRYRTLYTDQRGGGRSRAGTSSLSLSVFAEDMIALLDHLGLEQSSVLAHGFGALIAVTLAQHYPDRVTRIILVNPWLDMAMLARSAQRYAAHLSGDSDQALPPEEALDPYQLPPPAELIGQAVDWVGGKQLLDTMLFASPASRLRLEHTDAEALLSLQPDSLHAESGDPLATEEASQLWSLSVLEQLPSLTQPLIIVAGTHDKSSYPEQIESALQAAPHALVSLLDSAHYPWLDDADTLSEILYQAMAVPRDGA